MTGRVAVVTGAGSGIGRVVAAALLDAGYRVALVGRRADALAETAAGREHALVQPTDVADPASVAALFDAVAERWGRLDLLVNNAGRGSPAVPVDEVAVDDWLAVVDTNLTGSFLCARAAFALMRGAAAAGRADHQQRVDLGALAAARQRRLHRDQARHHRPDQVDLAGRAAVSIACGQIDIGNAETEMTARMADGVPQADGSVRPEPRFDARHVADAVLLMAGLPLDTNVQFLTITATTMPFIGRG